VNTTTAVIALDGSQLSEASLAYLPMLKDMGELHVLLVAAADIFSEGVEIAGMEELVEREHNLLARYLDGVAADLHERLGLSVEVDVRDGHPDQEIVHAAEAADASLIVLTTHGRSGLDRWSIGSVADKVIRTARCNLLVIGPEAAGGSPRPAIKNILAPVDGSSHAEAAIEVAHQWAKASGATVHIVRCYQPPSVAYEAPAVPDLLAMVRESAEAYVDQCRKRLPDIEVRAGCFLGAAADQLKAYATANQIDLVVMASHGRRGLARAILGSVTDRMLHGPAPVLVVHPK
jgi:nucleotide-binding universal stress UspA family protein